MTNKMTKPLVVRQFEQAAGLRAFVENKIRQHPTERAEAISALISLFDDSPEARSEVAREYVELIYQQLKSQEAVQSRAANLQRRRQKVVPIVHQILEGRGYNELYEVGHDELQTLVTEHFGNAVSTWNRDDWDFAYRQKIIAQHEKLEKERYTKSESFDRMVEALDAIQVGNKLLGDCTGGDLLREAVRLENIAKEMTAQSVFYRQLAAIVGKTSTVRQANDRAGIVGLLTSRYSENA